MGDNQTDNHTDYHIKGKMGDQQVGHSVPHDDHGHTHVDVDGEQMNSGPPQRLIVDAALPGDHHSNKSK